VVAPPTHHLDGLQTRPQVPHRGVHAAAGGDCIDDVYLLHAGSTAKIVGHDTVSASTVGTWLRSLTFGHIRQLDAVTDRQPARGRPVPGRATRWCSSTSTRPSVRFTATASRVRRTATPASSGCISARHPGRPRSRRRARTANQRCGAGPPPRRGVPDVWHRRFHGPRDRARRPMAVGGHRPPISKGGFTWTPTVALRGRCSRSTTAVTTRSVPSKPGERIHP
jgi:hypothetical protein